MRRAKRQVDVVFGPVVRDRSMKEVVRVLRAVAGKEVLLTFIGESGTGKEVLARLAHELSERKGGPFVPINCAAIPDALFESELFGHERGAFTGARDRAKGKIEAAEGGTLFLDEIGEMPITMQAKLLRFLENRRFMRVGGVAKIDANIRLMFATLRPLGDEVQAGRFRADLFYRIQGITINVPRLRDRGKDIGPLLDQFIEQMSARHSLRPPRFGRGVRSLLLSYDWPGNVRELRNTVETICLLRDGRPVRVADLPEGIRNLNVPTRDEHDNNPTLTLSLNDGLDALTSQIVQAALDIEEGDSARAARRLQISPRTVQRYVAAARVHKGVLKSSA